VGSRAVLDAVKRKIPSPRRESNPRTPIVQPVAQRYTGIIIIIIIIIIIYEVPLLSFEKSLQRFERSIKGSP
jgi:hypothetical protein